MKARRVFTAWALFVGYTFVINSTFDHSYEWFFALVCINLFAEIVELCCGR